MDAITTRHLSKSFNGIPVVEDLNLEIPKGELFGLVGPDGAGKTTTMRLLTGIMKPSSGSAVVAGYDLSTDPEPVRDRIGYMSQQFGLYEDLTVMENILFFADLYDVQRRERPARIERLLGFSNLTPFKDRLAGKLSGGMKQKLGLACALIHTPEVLFLDEPTNGVDPVSRRDFWRILYDLLKDGITIFVSTAYLDEAERCMRVALMHRGRVLLLDEPQAIKRSFALPMIELWLDDARNAAKIARTIPGVASASVYGDRIHIAIAGGNVEQLIRDNLSRAGIAIREHRRILPSLEDVFITRVETRPRSE